MRKLILWALTGIVKNRHRKLRARVARRQLAAIQGEYVAKTAKTQAEDRDAALSWDQAPDFVIGERNDPYLYRWYIVPDQGRWPFGWLIDLFPKSKFAKDFAHLFSMNIYLHKFIRSDDDRALHDHPWDNISYLLDGCYIEHVFSRQPRSVAEGWEYEVPETKQIMRNEGDICFRKAETAHRVQLLPDNSVPSHRTANGLLPTWSLFITGRKTRGWGFWCPRGWRHWENFVTSAEDYRAGNSKAGAGCE